MNKQDFLAQLRQGLSGLPQDDAEERLSFYNEMIDDRVEEGLSEAEAVSAIGPVNAVVAQILADTPLTRLVREKVRPRRTLQWWEIVLLIVGSPLWLSLLIAAFAVLLAVYAVIWSLAVALWSVEVSFAAGTLGGVLSTAVLTLQGNGLTGLAMLSGSLLCAGLSIFLFFGCKAATGGLLRLTKKLPLWIKSLFIGKETIQ